MSALFRVGYSCGTKSLSQQVSVETEDAKLLSAEIRAALNPEHGLRSDDTQTLQINSVDPMNDAAVSLSKAVTTGKKTPKDKSADQTDAAPADAAPTA